LTSFLGVLGVWGIRAFAFADGLLGITAKETSHPSVVVLEWNQWSMIPMGLQQETSYPLMVVLVFVHWMTPALSPLLMVALELTSKLSCPLQEKIHPSVVMLEWNQLSMIPTHFLQDRSYSLLVVLVLDCLLQIVLWVLDFKRRAINPHWW
jgi:hypothetical protein